MAVKQLSDGNGDGTTLGQSATDLIAFHGATPSDQRAYTAQISTSAAVSGAFGYTSAQANGIITLLNEIQAILVEKGLMASS